MAKATRKQALGRGLSALLKEPSEKISASEKIRIQLLEVLLKLNWI